MERRVSGRHARRLPALTLAAALALAGCAGLEPEAEIDPAPTLGDAPIVAFSTAKPPATLAVETTRTGRRGIVQRITLENRTSLANENRLEVQLDVRLDGLSDALGVEPRVSVVRPPDPLSIRNFLAEEFPDLRMALSDTVPTSRYGHYAYATGRGRRGETCVLAWQVADEHATELPRNLYRMGLLFRFCDPNRSGRELLALFESIALVRGVGLTR